MKNSSSYSLSGYRGFTGRGSQNGQDNNRFSKAFDLVPHDRLLTEIAATGVDLRVVVWLKEFLLGRSQRLRVDGGQSNFRSAARERIRSSNIPRLC